MSKILSLTLFSVLGTEPHVRNHAIINGRHLTKDLKWLLFSDQSLVSFCSDCWGPQSQTSSTITKLLSACGYILATSPFLPVPPSYPCLSCRPVKAPSPRLGTGIHEWRLTDQSRLEYSWFPLLPCLPSCLRITTTYQRKQSIPTDGVRCSNNTVLAF